MEVKRPAEALAEFEATLTKEPNRFRALYGAARAAQAAGNRASASAYYATLLKLSSRAEPPVRVEAGRSPQGRREALASGQTRCGTNRPEGRHGTQNPPVPAAAAAVSALRFADRERPRLHPLGRRGSVDVRLRGPGL